MELSRSIKRSIKQSIKQSINRFCPQEETEDISKYQEFINEASKKFDEFDILDATLDLQQRVIETLKYEGDPVEAKKQDLEKLQQTITSMSEGNESPEEYTKAFLDNIGRGAFGGYELTPSFKPPEFPKNFKPAGREEYMENHEAIQDIIKKYSSEDNNAAEQVSSKPEPEDENKENDEKKANSSEDKQEDPEAENNDNEPSNEDEKLDLEISKKQQEIDAIQARIDEIQHINEEMKNENIFQEVSQPYEEEINELLAKNSMTTKKIETLYGKVRKSREKIDNVLKEIYSYQKEFEQIMVLKKCRPAKLNITKKILQTRLE